MINQFIINEINHSIIILKKFTNNSIYHILRFDFMIFMKIFIFLDTIRGVQFENV